MEDPSDRPALPEIEDSAGNLLRPGHIVKVLSSRLVYQALPNEATEDDAEKLANNLAVIHDIKGEDVDIEIFGKNIMARLGAVALRYHKEGLKKKLADSSEATIGSFVMALANEQGLKKAQRKLAWRHGMEETCGKTGRVVRILKNSEILVQFAWGPRYYYDPKALLISSEDKVESQDSKGNKFVPGTAVQVVTIASKFQTYQKTAMLPHTGIYSELPGMYAKVDTIRLKPFSSTNKVWIYCNQKRYYVNVESLQVVNSVMDQNGKIIKVGDEVKLSSDLEKAKNAQSAEYGGWNSKIEQFLGQVGTVTDILPDLLKFKSLMIEVEFDSEKVTLNPRTVVNTNVVVIENNYNELQEIKREDIVCSETKLGEGGFGAVYKGEWKQKDGSVKIVAVKQFHANIAAKFQMDAMQEAKTQFSLRHPNIVSLYGYSTNKDLWLIMDFIDGFDLGSIIHREKSELNLTDQKKGKIALQMSSAIAYIHQKGYLHCDIKPNNMMVDRNTEELYVCDFGIARYFDVTNYDPNKYVTQYTSNMGGTPYYLAPECYQRNKETGKYKAPSTHSDVWSLGLVLYELFTQKMMVTGPEVYAFIGCKSQNIDSKVKKNLMDIPKDIEPIIARALEFKRSIRPTAQQITEFFHEYLFDLTRG